MKSIKSSQNLTEVQIKNLANQLIKIIKDFYDKPENEEEFQKWLTSVAKP